MSSFKRLVIFVCLIAIAGSAFARRAKTPTPANIEAMKAAAPAKPSARPIKPRKILVFSLCQGFRHSSIPFGSKAIEIMGQKSGAYTSVDTKDKSVFTAENLKQYDLIFFNNTTKLTFDDAQRKAIMDFVKGGKGIAGIHGATDNFYDWPEAMEMMGGYFNGHPWGGGGTWAIKIEDPKSPVTAAFKGKDFKVNDEIYRTKLVKLRENSRVLVALDMNADVNRNARGVNADDIDIPISWIRSFGKGRVFYSAFGHTHHLFWNPAMLQHFLDGIQFAIGDLKANTTPIPLEANVTSDASLDKMLIAVKGFEYGKPRRALVAVNNHIVKISTDPKACVSAEKSLAAFIKTDATFAAKQFACQHLSVIGTSRSIPALKTLLSKDPKTAAMAIMTIERIGGPSAEQALLDNLSGAKGDVKIGIISALGMLRSSMSSDTLKGLTLSSDKKVAIASIAALNNMGAVDKLMQITDKVDSSLKVITQQAALEAISNSRKRVRKNNWKIPVYTKIYNEALTGPIKAAAFKGLTAQSKDNLRKMIIDGLKSDDSIIVDATVSIIPAITDQKKLESIFAVFDQLQPASQYKLLSAGELMGTPYVKGPALKSVKSDDVDVRISAMKALGKVGGAESFDVVADKMINAKGNEQKVARDSLYSLKGVAVDGRIVKMARSTTDNELLAELIMAIGYRNISGTASLMAKMTKSDDVKVAKQAFRAFAIVSKGTDLRTAVDLLVGLENDSLRIDAENALAITILSNDAPVTPVVSAFSTASATNTKCSLIKVLGKVGSADALTALKSAASDSDDEVKSAAIRAIAAWDDGSVAPYLLDICKKSTNNTHKILSFRGLCGTIAKDSDRTVKQNIKLFKKAISIAPSDNDRKQVFGYIGKYRRLPSLELVMTYFDDAKFHRDAALASLSIGRVVGRGDKKNKAVTAKAMKKLLKISKDERVLKGANRVLGIANE